jgi:choice-of-anchor C domain-containing protein
MTTVGHAIAPHSLRILSLIAMLVVAAAVGLPRPTSADHLNIIANGSFESGAAIPSGWFTTEGVGSTAITSWSVVSGGVDYIGGLWSASDGLRSIDLNACSAGSISQTFATVAGNTYEVTFDMAGNPDGGVKELSVSAAATSETFTFDTAGKSLAAMGWVAKSFTFTATGTSTTLAFTSLIAGCYGPALDNVKVAVLHTMPSTKDDCKNGGWKT